MPTRDEYDTMIILKSINYHLGGTEVCPTLVIQTGFTFQALWDVLTGFSFISLGLFQGLLDSCRAFL